MYTLEWGESMNPSEEIKINLPSWSLPREPVAISASWNRTLQINSIKIEIPEEIEIEDALNVQNFSYSNSVITLNEIMQTKDEHSKTNYASIIVSSPLQDKLKMGYTLNWKFYSNEQLILERICKLRVFRPNVKIIKYPKELELNDDGFDPKLNLTFKWEGFGDIEVELILKASGDIVSEGRSLFEEMIHRIYLIIIEGEEFVPDNQDKNSDELKIDREFIQSLAQEIAKLLEDRSTVIKTEPAILEVVCTWLKEKAIATEFDDYLASMVETLLLQVLTEVFEKNPVDGVRMSNPRTEIDTRITIPVHYLILETKYSDNMGNFYVSEEIEIPVNDIRSEESRFKRLKEIIDAQDWINASWKNVGRLKNE